MAIELIAEIVPQNGGAFPMVEDVHIKGGFQVRANNLDRDSIPVLNRKEGMRVLTIDSGTQWQLGPGLTNGDWSIVVGGGGGTPVKVKREVFYSSDFSFGGGLSTLTVGLTFTEDTNADLLDLRDLFINGKYNPYMTSAAPAGAGEWRINAGNLEIWGDVTVGDDEFAIRYPIV